jgi:hypothetical protein
MQCCDCLPQPIFALQIPVHPNSSLRLDRQRKAQAVPGVSGWSSKAAVTAIGAPQTRWTHC